jgi:uncharacterized iron-regulated membrane protein
MLGLVAPFLAVLCLTGLAYVFSPHLNDLVYSHELLVGPHRGTPRPLDEQIAAAIGAHHEGTLSSLVVPSDPGRTTGVVLAVPGLAPDLERTVYVDPYTAQVRGALDTWYDTHPYRPPSTRCTGTSCWETPDGSTPSSPPAGCPCW